jgi:hypothetical protein
MTDPETILADDQLHRIRNLYRRAFEEFGIMALWNVRAVADPSIQDALAITRQLRTEGNLAARQLAEDIEGLARAGH